MRCVGQRLARQFPAQEGGELGEAARGREGGCACDGLAHRQVEMHAKQRALRLARALQRLKIAGGGPPVRLVGHGASGVQPASDERLNDAGAHRRGQAIIIGAEDEGKALQG